MYAGAFLYKTILNNVYWMRFIKSNAVNMLISIIITKLRNVSQYKKSKMRKKNILRI